MKLKKNLLALISMIFLLVNAVNSQNITSDKNDTDVPEFKKGGTRYEEKEDWPKMYPNCNGTRQSPINIDTMSPGIVPTFYYDNLDLGSYEQIIRNANVTNNGHSVSVTFEDVITISGGAAKRSSYQLQQCHFHFGRINGQGSEHTVNGQAFDLEIHLVHKNVKYASMDTALNKPDGLLVIAILGKVDEKLADESSLNFVTNNMERVSRPSSVKINDTIRLSSLFPTSDGEQFSYWTYRGSLTTPNCNQVVTWVISAYALAVTNQQLMTFRRLLDFNGEPIADNYRSVQPINGRRIGFVNPDWITS